MSKNKFDLRHKETLTLFLKEFFELFFPEITPKIRFETAKFIDKELSALFPKGDGDDVENRTDALVLAEAYIADIPELFLFHWEHMGEKQADFEERMFHYFCGAYYKFRLPVFPVALFTDSAKWRIRIPEKYTMKVFDREIASYGYHLIKLKNYKAEEFEKKIGENPLAAAYLPLTDYPAEKRPEIKAKAVRGIANAEKGKKQTTLYSLINASLPLNKAEDEKYREIIQNHPEYKEAEMLESIKEVGIEEGKFDMIARLITKRFGKFPLLLKERLENSRGETLDRFGEAIFDFKNIRDAEEWWDDPANYGNA